MALTDKERAICAWLWRYQASLRKERELLEELEQLEAKACRITPLISGMPGNGGDGQAVSRAVEKIVEAKQKLAAQISTCLDVRQEVLGVLQSIRDPRDYEILRRRYILGQKWEEIAVQLPMDYSYVHHRHRQAVRLLTLPIESHTKK